MRWKSILAILAMVLFVLSISQVAILCGDAPTPQLGCPHAVICAGIRETPVSDTLAPNLGTPVRLTAKGSSGETLAWKVIPPASETVILLDAVDKTGTPVLVLFPADVTPFYVELLAVRGGTLDAALVTIAPNSAKPAPPRPGPSPNPPQPGPASRTIPAGHLWLICILSNLTQQTDSQGAIESSELLLKMLDAKGNHFRWVDVPSAPAALATFVSRARADGLPRALIVDDSTSGGSTVRASVPLTNESDIRTLLKKWGG